MAEQTEQEFSPQQIQEAIKSDPWGYHGAVLERSNNNMDAVLGAAHLQSKKFIDNMVGGLIVVVKLHSEELRIFRTMESHIHNGTGTEAIMQDLLVKLQVFRAESKQKSVAYASEITSKQQPS